MSDNQRRAYCRILFLCICAFPTAVSAYWICHPQTAENWETAIQAQLGVTTSIDYIETPGPNETILYNLEFSDPDLGTIFKVVEARIRFGETNVVSFPHRIQSLNSQGVSRLIESINQHLSRSPRVNRRWRIEFEKDAIIEESVARTNAPISRPMMAPRFTMTELHIDIVPLVEGTSATMQFRLANADTQANSEANGELNGLNVGGGSSDQYVTCEISRTRKRGHMIELATRGVAVPVWLVSDLAPMVTSSLGDGASFTGEFKMSSTLQDSDIYFNGRFTNVDTAKSIPRPDLANRFVNIELTNCRFQGGKPTSWDAVLSGPGRTPRRIDVRCLIVPGEKIDPSEAIASTLGQPSYRSAQNTGDVP